MTTHVRSYIYTYQKTFGAEIVMSKKNKDMMDAAICKIKYKMLESDTNSTFITQQTELEHFF